MMDDIGRTFFKLNPIDYVTLFYLVMSVDLMPYEVINGKLKILDKHESLLSDYGWCAADYNERLNSNLYE